MAEPAVGRGAVPVLYAGRDIDSVAGIQLNGILALLLIIAAAGNAYEDLSAAAFGVVDMPVVGKLKCSQFPSCVDFTGFNCIQNCVYCYYLSFFSKIALKHRPHYFHI